MIARKLTAIISIESIPRANPHHSFAILEDVIDRTIAHPLIVVKMEIAPYLTPNNAQRIHKKHTGDVYKYLLSSHDDIFSTANINKILLQQCFSNPKFIFIVYTS